MGILSCSPCLSTPWYFGVSAWTTFVPSDLFYWWLLALLAVLFGILWDMCKQKSHINVHKCGMVTLLMCRFWHNSVPVGGSQRLIFNRWQSPTPYNNGCSYFHYCHLMTHMIVGKDLDWVITGIILQRTRCTSNSSNGDGCSGWMPLLSIFQVYLLLRTGSHTVCCHIQG